MTQKPMTKTVTLGEIIEKPISGEWGEEGTGIKVLRSTNFTNEGYLNLSDVVTRDIPEKKIHQKKLIPGDIIIEKSGGSPNQPVGRVVYFDIPDEDFLFSNFTSVIRPKTGIHPRFLFWFLFGNHLNKQTLNYQNKTTGIINLQLQRYIDETKIPLPSLPEQRRIAALLDRADALRQKDRQLLAHYDKLAQSVFLDLFGDPVKNEKGWERVKIRDLVKEVKYGTSKPAEDKGTFPYLRMNNITYEGHWNFSDLKYINLTKAEESKYLLQKGDLVFNRTNSKELVGKTAVYQREDQMAIAGYLIRSRVNEKATPEYISAYLNSTHGKATLRGMCKNIIGMANINAQELQEIDILQPPLSLQTQFAGIIEQIEGQKALVRRQMAASEGLFGRLLQECFG